MALRKPFVDLTNLRHPPHELEGGNGRTSYRDRSGGSSTSNLPPLRAAQTNRRVVSDPVHGIKERRKFLDPIVEVEDERGNEERPTPGLRVRFRSKSVAAAIPSLLQARDHSPATGGSDPHDQAEGLSLEDSVSILEARAEEENAKDVDDGMNTEELLRDFEEAFYSPPPPSTLRQVPYNEPTRRIKSILGAIDPESHSTPAVVKPNAAPRRVSSSPPAYLPPSEPPCHPFDNPPSKGIGMPRPKPFTTSFLPPQTHKVSRGQLVILPSRTLLVDFREGERRQGRQGVEVLIISPDGEEVRIVPRVLAAPVTHHPFRLVCSAPRT